MANAVSHRSDDLLRYDPSGTMLPGLLTPEALRGHAAAVEAARKTVVEQDEREFAEQKKQPDKRNPLDAGFFRLPERLLEAYHRDRSGSELGRILTTAERLRQELDRVVLLGIGGSYMGAKALMQALCNPYFNELSRAERNGHPRMYFEGNNLDNDSIQSLLGVVTKNHSYRDFDDWGVIVISKSGGTMETAVAFRLFLDALRKCYPDAQACARHIVPVTGKTGKLASLVQRLGCAASETFEVPDGVGGRFSILSPVGLLPAAVLGIDVVKLLEGAACMNDHFCSAPAATNVVLQYVSVGHLMEKLHGLNLRILSVWSSTLESVGLWYDQLLAESLGKQELGATPITTVNTRDLHSRAQQHQEGRKDKLITNVIVDKWNSPALSVQKSDFNEDDLNTLAGKTVPELMSSAIRGTNTAYREDSRATADLHLPAVNEFYLGQLFQMLMLATVVEGRLIDINPYGQPGVEKYKKFMRQDLGLDR